MPPKILRLAGTVAAVLTVPLTVIAAYALFLRVQQYGWTVDRITVAAVLLVALSYAGGYAHAALTKGEWLASLPRWNFAVSLLAVALVILLFTPIASPQRIAVNDQMARLRSGVVSPQEFDFRYLRDHGGRYGKVALSTLAQDQNALLKRRAQNTLNDRIDLPQRLTPQTIEDQVTVYPRGERLPQTFLKNDWSKTGAGSCLIQLDTRCDIVLTDLDGDGKREAVVIASSGWIEALGAPVLRETESGWRIAGYLDVPRNCIKMNEALRKGDFRGEVAQQSWSDFVIGGIRIPVTSVLNPTCPK
jgi:uncharacterized protein DUF4153